MRIAALAVVLAACLPSVASKAAPGCQGNAPAVSSSGATVRTVDGAVVVRTTRLNVDADGAPNSYRIDGRGLSATCDGVAAIENGKRVGPDDPEWERKCAVAWGKAKADGDYRGVSIFGFAKDPSSGKPLIQGAGDPLPNVAYVSTTTMPVPGTPALTQRHYVDATSIPYVVLPKRFADANHIPLGAVAAVFRARNQKLAFAVFADTGPALGEASVRLHEDLGSKPIVLRHGIARAMAGLEKESVVMAVFPGTVSAARLEAAEWRQDISTRAGAALAAWGGQERLSACLQ